MIKDIRRTLVMHLPIITFVLFVIQPLTDILSYWLGNLGAPNTLTLVLRLLILAATFFIGFCVSDRPRIYAVFIAVALAIGIGHAVASVTVGYIDPIADLTNYVRVLLAPASTIALISFLHTQKSAEVFDAVTSGITANLFIIAAVMLISSATGTDPKTYSDAGVIGWFSNTNSQSAILTVIAPVAVAGAYRRHGMRRPIFWLTLAASLISMYMFGTRLALAGVFATAFGLAVSILITNPRAQKDALLLFAVGAAFLLLSPVSPMAEHQSEYASVQSTRQDSIDSLLGGADLSSADGLTDDEKAKLTAVLAPVYEKYAPDFVEMFGITRTVEIFDYSSDVSEITATRPKKLIFAELLMQDSPVICRLFGIEIGRFTVGENNYDVENDFHGIYYLYGAVGLAAMMGFIGYFVFLIIKALVTDARRYFTLDAAAWGIALIMCIGHAVFTAGVLRRPNASFYLAAVLAAVYHLTRADRDNGGSVKVLSHL